MKTSVSKREEKSPSREIVTSLSNLKKIPDYESEIFRAGYEHISVELKIQDRLEREEQREGGTERGRNRERETT